MTTVEKYQVKELYAELRSKLDRDPLFTGDVEHMDTLLVGLPDTVEQLFVETLHDAAQCYRYAAVLLMADLVRRFAPSQAFNLEGPMRVASGEMVFFGGDLHVAGHLRLDHGAVLVVAGDVELEGSFIGGEHSVLGVSGTMTARNAMTPGEMMVAQRLAIRELVYLYRNDHSSLAPAVRCRLLVQNDGFNTLRKISAETQIDELLTEERPERLQQVAVLLGLDAVESVEQLESALCQRLIDGANGAS